MLSVGLSVTRVEQMSADDCGMRKCYYQLDDCYNWSDAGLTLGFSQSYIGPKDDDGRSTLINYPAPICPACLDAKPDPLRANPGLYTQSADGKTLTRTITLHRTEVLADLGDAARLGFSDDYPGYQFLILTDAAAWVADELR